VIGNVQEIPMIYLDTAVFDPAHIDRGRWTRKQLLWDG
jgi:hypothetical protein